VERPVTDLVDPSDRVLGCVLGLALGDALGAPFEFSRARDLPSPLPAFERPWLDMPPGSTTDDTAMAMNLVESLAARDGFDADDLIARHLAWFRSGPPDVGNLTSSVLRRVERLDAPSAHVATDIAHEIWEQRGPEVSAGNGSVMYCAPLGVAYANRPETLLELAPRLSALTHHDERCGTAVLAVTLTVAGLVRGDDALAVLRSSIDAVLDRPGGEELEFLVGAVGGSRPIDGPEQGFVLYATAAAFQALLRGGPFEDELRRVVALGGDTDTNAAVAGALIGSRDGHRALPAGWLDLLRGATAIGEAAAGLVPLALRGA
jgi:ADP-ribosyl-[dinitrogen reductase] hydrolase